MSIYRNCFKFSISLLYNLHKWFGRAESAAERNKTGSTTVATSSLVGATIHNNVHFGLDYRTVLYSTVQWNIKQRISNNYKSQKITVFLLLILVHKMSQNNNINAKIKQNLIIKMSFKILRGDLGWSFTGCVILLISEYNCATSPRWWPELFSIQGSSNPLIRLYCSDFKTVVPIVNNGKKYQNLLSNPKISI